MINPYNYMDKDNKCKCNPVIIGMTGPRGPQGRQGGYRSDRSSR